MLKKFLSEYFGFNKQQRRGLLLLAAFSLILLIVRITFPYFIHPDEIEIKNLPLFPLEKNLYDDKQRSDTNSSQNSKNNLKSLKVDTLSKGHMFVFDPNTVQLEQLLLLGFSEKTANTFIKYRSKGFQFKHKEDLKKVYGLNESLYQSLESYIQIESINSKNEKTKSKQTTISKIEINAADTQLLLSIAPIDLSAAKRILKYKEKLGGFVSLNQLQEVYGFDIAFCNKIKPYFICDENLVKKMDLNQTTFNELNKHPYISEDLAKQIINLRKKTKFDENHFSELLQDKALFEKLKPYLSFEE